jgi:hypothetical protein
VSSTSVTSTCRSSAARITAPNASIRAECRSPTRGLPAVATPIPKRSAATWRDRPPSTAAITRARRSSDKVFAIAADPRPADRVNQITPASGKHFHESVQEERALGLGLIL